MTNLLDLITRGEVATPENAGQRHHQHAKDAVANFVAPPPVVHPVSSEMQAIHEAAQRHREEVEAARVKPPTGRGQ